MKSWIKIQNQYTCPCCDSQFNESQLHMETCCSCPSCDMPLLVSDKTVTQNTSVEQYAVFITHSLEIEATARIFTSEEKARDYLMSAFFSYLSKEIREGSELRQNDCFINSDDGIAQVAWKDGEKTEFRLIPIFPDEGASQPEKVSPELLYELYKLNWCNERDWNYDAVHEAELRGEEYKGQMYACFNEFMSCEYEIPGYTDSLLSDIDIIRKYISK